MQEHILTAFRSRLQSRGGTSGNKTQYYAFKTFAGFVGGRDLHESDFNESLMTEWMSWMFYEGLSRSTALSYLRLVYALATNTKYAKSPELKQAHQSVCRRVNELPEAIFRRNVGGRVIHRLQELMERGRATAGETRLGIDLTVFAVLCGGLDFNALAAWKRTDELPDSPMLREIHCRYASPRRKFLFPLGQSELAPRRIAERLTALFRNALRSCGLDIASNPSATAFDLWLTAVYESTGSIQRAVDIAGKTSATSPAFVMMSPGPVPEDESAERARILGQVRDIVVNDPVQWHVMRLRPGVTCAKVMERLDDTGQSARMTDVYSPTVEIARRVGRKIVFDDRPAIPGLVFFMSRASDITPIFRNIGDLAWCYRTGRGPGAPYAVITDREIRTLQRAIGYIDPGSEIAAEDSVVFEPGDRILIRGGEMAGMCAEITLVEKKSGELLYHLSFPEGNGLSWAVSSSRLTADKVADQERGLDSQ